MKNLVLLKKYLPGILYSLLGLFIIFIIYKLIKAATSAANSVADKTKAEITAVATGIPTDRVQTLRSRARSLASHYGTAKGSGIFGTGWFAGDFFLTANDTLKYFRDIESAAELKVIKNAYEQDATNGNSLADDLVSSSKGGGLSDSDLHQIPFIDTIL